MMKGQIAGLMRQAQQMQEKMKQVQDSLATTSSRARRVQGW